MIDTIRRSQRTLPDVTAYRAIHLLQRFVLYLLAVVLAVSFMVPFFWAVASSLKDITEVYVFPPQWLPKVPKWQNYHEIVTTVPYARWALNSTVVTLLAVLGTLLSSSLVGYSFARFRYPGRDAFFLVTLGTMMLPVEVTIIPTYLLFNKLGWIDSLKPLFVPEWFGGSAFYIFLFRQFFLAISRDLDEAALIDGADPFRIYWAILLPLSKPVIATAAIIGFIAHWNAFLAPLIFLNSPERFTLALGLRWFQVMPGWTTGLPTEHLLMGASVMMALPPIVLFFLAQRYFVRGIILSGIKG
jgi:ABC-type glycerol-3-phosphate transport system permease component